MVFRGVSFWTEEKDGILKSLVAEGRSFSAIARIMGCGTRNMPLCRFNRMRAKDPTLKHPGSTLNVTRVNKPVYVRPPKVAIVKFDPATIIPVELDGVAITLENRAHQMCEYPLGDPLKEDFRYCGHDKKAGSPYCEPHHKLCRHPMVRKPREDHRGKQRA